MKLIEKLDALLGSTKVNSRKRLLICLMLILQLGPLGILLTVLPDWLSPFILFTISACSAFVGAVLINAYFTFGVLFCFTGLVIPCFFYSTTLRWVLGVSPLLVGGLCMFRCFRWHARKIEACKTADICSEKNLFRNVLTWGILVTLGIGLAMWLRDAISIVPIGPNGIKVHMPSIRYLIPVFSFSSLMLVLVPFLAVTPAHIRLAAEIVRCSVTVTLLTALYTYTGLFPQIRQTAHQVTNSNIAYFAHTVQFSLLTLGLWFGTRLVLQALHQRDRKAILLCCLFVLHCCGAVAYSYGIHELQVYEQEHYVTK